MLPRSSAASDGCHYVLERFGRRQARLAPNFFELIAGPFGSAPQVVVTCLDELGCDVSAHKSDRCRASKGALPLPAAPPASNPCGKLPADLEQRVIAPAKPRWAAPGFNG